ncbi:MAG: YncE family protein [Microvirga sp.]
MIIGFARLALALAAGISVLPAAAQAQLAVSANDNKAYLDNGVAKTVPNAQPDTVAIIDLSANPPKLLAELQAPASVVGPPGSVAVAADESFALVTSAMKVDPADPTKQVPDDRLSVIDLKSSPPKVTQTVTVGKGAAGVSINKAGTLALVANRSEGTVSVLTISGGKVEEKEKIKLGEANSGPSHPIFTRDGAMALVTRDNDHKISVLTVAGDKVEYGKRDINAGLRPYQIDTTGNGDVAIVANIGIGGGDADTISVIDLKAKPSRVVNTVTVGQTPEGLKMSPDGQHVAVTVMNGSNKPKESPFFNDFGLVKIYRLSGHNLTQVAEAPVGHWCQGAAWSKDGKQILVQCMVEKEIFAFSFDGGKNLQKIGSIKTNGGAAGIRTAEP